MDVVDAPALPPGACFLSGSEKGPFIDTGLTTDDVPEPAHIYVCFDTVSDMAQMLGFAPPEAARRQREQIARLEADLTEARAACEAMVAANEALVRAGYEPRPVEDTVPAGDVEDVFAWVAAAGSEEGRRARAAAAIVAELAERNPRRRLIETLTLVGEEVPA